MTQGQGPYNANENRGYPVSDAATGVDDAGVPLPHDAVVDVELALPADLGAEVWLAALTVTRTLATAVLAASGSGAPVAAVSVPAPVVPYRAYPLDALADGVAGWIVFGRGAATPYAGRFSDPRQALLLARCVRSYPTPPVTSLRKLGRATGLAGVVALEAGPDIALAIEPLDTGGGRVVDAIVIRLADSLDRDVYALYAGPCRARPESGTCARPPLEAISGVAPDCDGNIDLDFRGVTPLSYPGGILLELPVGLAAACGRPFDMPTSDGSLPGEYRPGCSIDGSSRSGDEGSSIGGDPAAGPWFSDFSEGGGTPGASAYIPWTDLNPDGPHDGVWRVYTASTPGTHLYRGGDVRPVRASDSTAQRNVTLYRFRGDPPATVPKFVEVALRLLPGSAQAAAGLVANYRRGGDGAARYVEATVDAASNQFLIRAFDGAGYRVLAAKPPRHHTIAPGYWYKVQLATAAGASGRVEVTATFEVLDDPAAHAIRVLVHAPVEAADYGAPDDRRGLCGFGADRSRCEFAYFYMEEA